jgi:hypothetical protein
MPLRFVLLLIAALLAPLLGAAPGYACDCHDGGLPCEAYWKSPVIFVGRAEAVTIINQDSRLGARIQTRFRVAEVLRGPAAREIDIVTGSTSCDLRFTPGEDWVIYASQRIDGKGLSTSTCSRSRPLGFAADDLDYARSLKSTPDKGRILGTVRYRGADSALPVKGARLTFHGPSSVQVSAVTGADGAYEVEAPAGIYRVSTALPRGMFGEPSVSLVNLVDNRACAAVDVFAEFPAM